MTDGSQASRRMAAQPSLLLLVAMTGVPALSTNVYLPSMPGLVEYFRTTGATVQLTLTLYLLVLGAGQLLYGPLSDRFGRRPALLGGLVIYVVGSALCLAAVSVEALIVGRVVQAAGGCAGVIIGRAMVRDVYQRGKAASMLGYVTMTMAMASAFAPALGAFLQEWHGWRAAFTLMAVLGVVLWLSAFRCAGETLVARASLPSITHMASTYGAILRTSRFRRYGGYSICTMASYYAFVAGAPHVVIDLFDQAPSTFGLYYICAGGAYISGNFLAGRWSERFGLEIMTRTGGTIAALAELALIVLIAAGFRHPAAVFIPVAISFLGTGLSQPSAMVGAIDALPKYIGAGAGLLGAAQLGAGGLASLVVGLTEHHGALPFALLSGGLLLLALVILLAPRARD